MAEGRSPAEQRLPCSQVCVLWLSGIVMHLFIFGVVFTDFSVLYLKSDKDLAKEKPLVTFRSTDPGAVIELNMNMRQFLFHPYKPCEKGEHKDAGTCAEYGIGVSADSMHRDWGVSGNTLKKVAEQVKNEGHSLTGSEMMRALEADIQFHPANFFGCDDMVKDGTVLQAFSYLLIIIGGAKSLACFAQIILPNSRRLSVVNPILSFLGIVFALVLLIVGLGIHSQEYECDNPLVPKLTLADHFHVSPLILAGSIIAIIFYVGCTILEVVVVYQMFKGDWVSSGGGEDVDAQLALLAERHQSQINQLKEASEKEQNAALDKLKLEKDLDKETSREVFEENKKSELEQVRAARAGEVAAAVEEINKEKDAEIAKLKKKAASPKKSKEEVKDVKLSEEELNARMAEERASLDQEHQAEIAKLIKKKEKELADGLDKIHLEQEAKMNDLRMTLQRLSKDFTEDQKTWKLEEAAKKGYCSTFI